MNTENTLGNRIQFVIDHTVKKKVRFAESIGVEQSYISQLTSNRRTPSDRIIRDICRIYNVDEHWLRTGEGNDEDPFLERSDEDVLEDILREANASPAIRSFVAAWAQLDPQQQAVLEKFVADYVADYHRRAADAAAAEAAHIATSRATEPEAPEAAQSS